jgi:hypothetical protein
VRRSGIQDARARGDLVQRMYFPDTDLVAKKFPEWSERWGREIAR